MAQSVDLYPIGITVYPDTHIEEHKGWALLDDTLHENWISEKFAKTLGLQPPPHTDKLSADWRERKLQSVGEITFSWSTSDEEIPSSYTTTFHVAQDNSVHVIIGNELLSKKPYIRDSRKGVLILTSSKEGTEAKQAEIARTQEKHDAKTASRDARLAERAQKELLAKSNESGQAGSPGVKEESSVGSGVKLN